MTDYEDMSGIVGNDAMLEALVAREAEIGRKRAKLDSRTAFACLYADFASMPLFPVHEPGLGSDVLNRSSQILLC